MPAKKTEKDTEKKVAKKEIKKTVKKTVKKILKDDTKKVAKKTTKSTKNKENKETASERKVVDLIEKTLSSGKAEDIVIIDLTEKSAIADYLVIANGRAPRHVVALAEQVQLRLKKTGIPALLEGKETGDWVIVDAGNVIIHVFHPESRELYCIEELWDEETPKHSK